MLNRTTKVLVTVMFCLALGVAAPATGCGCGSTPQDEIEGYWGGAVSFPGAGQVRVMVTFDYEYDFSCIARGEDGAMLGGLSVRGSYDVDYETLSIQIVEVFTDGAWRKMDTPMVIELPYYEPEGTYDDGDRLVVTWVNYIDFDRDGTEDATWVLTRSDAPPVG
jgi:hypothetical protein